MEGWDYMAGLFDIIGPVMVGPSSSHTAGAVRIGLVTRKLLGEKPVSAVVSLHGSFKATGVGHGTHQAIIAGLLEMKPDDVRIPGSFQYAEKEGLSFRFEQITLRDAHSNTALIEVEGINGRRLKVQASSVGGGRIVVNKIDGIEVNFTGENHTLIVHNMDQVGHVSKVTTMLAEQGVNIATMQLFRNKRGGHSVMVLELDQTASSEKLKELEMLSGIEKVTYIEAVR